MLSLCFFCRGGGNNVWNLIAFILYMVVSWTRNIEFIIQIGPGYVEVVTWIVSVLC